MFLLRNCKSPLQVLGWKREAEANNVYFFPRRGRTCTIPSKLTQCRAGLYPVMEMCLAQYFWWSIHSLKNSLIWPMVTVWQGFHCLSRAVCSCHCWRSISDKEVVQSESLTPQKHSFLGFGSSQEEQILESRLKYTLPSHQLPLL